MAKWERILEICGADDLKKTKTNIENGSLSSLSLLIFIHVFLYHKPTKSIFIIFDFTSFIISVLISTTKPVKGGGYYMIFRLLARSAEKNNPYQEDFLFNSDYCKIGSGDDCDIILRGRGIIKLHAVIIRNKNGFFIKMANNDAPVMVNGSRIRETKLANKDKITIGNIEMLFQIIEGDAKFSSVEAPPARMTPGTQPAGKSDFSELKTQLQNEMKNQPQARYDSTKRMAASTVESSLKSEKKADYNPTRRMESPFLDDLQTAGVSGKQGEDSGGTKFDTDDDLPETLFDAVDKKTAAQSPAPLPAEIKPSSQKDSGAAKSEVNLESYMQSRSYIYDELLRKTNLKQVRLEALKEKDTREKFKKITAEIVLNLVKEGSLPEKYSVEKLLKESLNDAIGLGPLEDVYGDSNVEKIFVNSAADIYIVTRQGKKKLDTSFINDDHVLLIINRLLSPSGQSASDAKPLINVELPDKTVINAILPPVSPKGPVFTVFKSLNQPENADDLIQAGTLNEAMIDFLEYAVKYRQNLLICGKKGSGKSTLLNVLADFVDPADRIISVEKKPGLKISKPHVLSLIGKGQDDENIKNASPHEILKNALDMIPDSIICDDLECDEIVCLIQAINSGQAGAIASVAMNNADNMLKKIETTFFNSQTDSALKEIRESIVNAIDFIIITGRFQDGKHRILEISELCGYKDERYILTPVFYFDLKQKKGEKSFGEYRQTEHVPSFIRENDLA